MNLRILRISARDFEWLASHLRIKPATLDACREVLVNGQPTEAVFKSLGVSSAFGRSRLATIRKAYTRHGGLVDSVDCSIETQLSGKALPSLERVIQSLEELTIKAIDDSALTEKTVRLIEEFELKLLDLKAGSCDL